MANKTQGDKDYEAQLKRTIFTEDGFIIDGKRTIVPPWGYYIPVSELIGATITEIHPRSEIFRVKPGLSIRIHIHKKGVKSW
jgi:hypothetical protein